MSGKWLDGMECVTGSRGHTRARRVVFFFKQKTANEIYACLVGSEMNIRDSYKYHGSPSGSRKSLRKPCFLYTSDASDVLLCVEFVGRLFI